MCSDFSLHLLQISYQLEHLAVRNFNSNFHFVGDTNNIITALELSFSESSLFIGTKSGNVYILDVSNFKLKDLVINQENIIKSISSKDLKKPGSVETLADKPNDTGKILIGFSRSLIALWNYETETIVNYFFIEQVSLFSYYY